MTDRVPPGCREGGPLDAADLASSEADNDALKAPSRRPSAQTDRSAAGIRPLTDSITNSETLTGSGLGLLPAGAPPPAQRMLPARLEPPGPDSSCRCQVVARAPARVPPAKSAPGRILPCCHSTPTLAHRHRCRAGCRPIMPCCCRVGLPGFTRASPVRVGPRSCDWLRAHRRLPGSCQEPAQRCAELHHEPGLQGRGPLQLAH